MQGLVSTVIITHNRKDLVVNAIRSVQNQDYQNIELIVVDDASDDGTYDLLIKKSKDENFKYIYIPKEESKGGNHARNLGAEYAHGEFLAFLDDDDEWLQSKIRKQVEFLQEHKDIDAVACGRIIVYDNGRTKPQKIKDRLEGDLREKIWTRTAFNTSELMLRASVFNEVGKFDENLRYWQEYEFSIRLCQLTEIGLLKERLILYRVMTNDKNKLTNNVKNWEESVKYIDEKHKELLNSMPKDIQDKHKLMIARDGALRAENARDKFLLSNYIKEIFKYDHSIKSILKYSFMFLIGEIVF